MRLIRKVNSVLAQIGKFFYNLGNEFVAITGGWAAYGWSGLGSLWVGNTGTVTKPGDRIRVEMNNIGATGQSGALRVGNVINLTNKDTLKATVSYTLGQPNTGAGGFQRLYLFVSDVTSGDWTTSAVYDAILLMIDHDDSTEVTASNTEYSLDVSALSGDFYICLGYVWRYQNGSSWFELHKMEWS